MSVRMSNPRRLAALALCATLVTSGGCITRYVSMERWENKNLAYLAGEIAVGAALGAMIAYDPNPDPTDGKHAVQTGAVVGGAGAVFGDMILAGVVAIFTGDWSGLDDD
jgi:hypothetical protein